MRTTSQLPTPTGFFDDSDEGKLLSSDEVKLPNYDPSQPVRENFDITKKEKKELETELGVTGDFELFPINNWSKFLAYKKKNAASYSEETMARYLLTNDSKLYVALEGIPNTELVSDSQKKGAPSHLAMTGKNIEEIYKNPHPHAHYAGDINLSYDDEVRQISVKSGGFRHRADTRLLKVAYLLSQKEKLAEVVTLRVYDPDKGKLVSYNLKRKQLIKLIDQELTPEIRQHLDNANKEGDTKKLFYLHGKSISEAEFCAHRKTVFAKRRSNDSPSEAFAPRTKRKKLNSNPPPTEFGPSGTCPQTPSLHGRPTPRFSTSNSSTSIRPIWHAPLVPAGSEFGPLGANTCPQTPKRPGPRHPSDGQFTHLDWFSKPTPLMPANLAVEKKQHTLRSSESPHSSGLSSSLFSSPNTPDCTDDNNHSPFENFLTDGELGDLPPFQKL